MELLEYIQKKNKNKFSVQGKVVYLKNPATENTDYKKAIQMALSKIPKHLLSNVREFHIGEYEELEKRKIQGLYKNRQIILTNKHKKTIDVVDDIVHEVAHSVEDMYKKEIYSDGLIEKEFLRKRKKLWLLLKNKGFDVELSNFLKVKYDIEFDRFLYVEVGYPLMRALTSKLFFSPYAATSLREYFANSFEAFFMKEEVDRLKKISPILYKKNVMLLDMGE